MPLEYEKIKKAKNRNQTGLKGFTEMHEATSTQMSNEFVSQDLDGTQLKLDGYKGWNNGSRNSECDDAVSDLDIDVPD